MSDKHHQIDVKKLPSDYPTHRHSGGFWEQLGRTVATFGYLEQVLGRAIFALTATREYNNHHEIEKAYSNWPGQLERALYDALGGLIVAYDKALRNHHDAPVCNPDELIEDLHNAAQLRNVLCHGSWQVPDAEGKSLPMFVDKKMKIFATPIDAVYLQQVRHDVVNLACAVINSVSSLGLRFPGADGPGRPIL